MLMVCADGLWSFHPSWTPTITWSLPAHRIMAVWPSVM